LIILFIVNVLLSCKKNENSDTLVINREGYFEKPGINVIAFNDYYPEGHQGGITIIQNGKRIAVNGDIRLEPTPGQWQPVPKLQKREVDTANNTITAWLSFPDSSKNRKGFNPVIYPDFYLSYHVKAEAIKSSVKITVDIDKELPAEWVGKVGFNLELFPGDLFGKSFIMDDQTGIFHPQVNGPFYKDENGEFQVSPMATGKKLTIAPENDELRLLIESKNGSLELLDGRAKYNNGWYVVRSEIPAKTTKNAVEWLITPNGINNWKYVPVIHVNQLGFHPKQTKKAIIEIDKNDKNTCQAELIKILEKGKQKVVKKSKPQKWGQFLRYKYCIFDFSEIKEPGIYFVKYDKSKSSIFRIENNIYNRHAWQPVIEYFLPVQMCHMRVNDRYRVWHGLCHMDDALMAPTDTIHFDGYFQGPSTLTSYKAFQHVPNLNTGGWHDAGDYDLRIESQAGTVYTLSLIYEEFKPDYDITSINQQEKIVEMHLPDSIPDILQQIEHGVLSIIDGYKSLGRLYRGIIASKLRQYVLLGDGSTMTDNKIQSPIQVDDRWVFTENNPSHEFNVVASLAAAARVLKEYNNKLSEECLDIAKKLMVKNVDITEKKSEETAKIKAFTELYLTTSETNYLENIINDSVFIYNNIKETGWLISRINAYIHDNKMQSKLLHVLTTYNNNIDSLKESTPFGVPYKPFIWGAGWIIQRYGVEQYYLYKAWPEIFNQEGFLNALNFILGSHPGCNTASFVSGVGAKSVDVAYGINRADWSYIPGGVVSGTALIRPDFPELKRWPYLWQQTEYVIGGGATNYMFLVLAANENFKASH